VIGVAGLLVGLYGLLPIRDNISRREFQGKEDIAWIVIGWLSIILSIAAFGIFMLLGIVNFFESIF
jgi:hypothetical protein